MRASTIIALIFGGLCALLVVGGAILRMTHSSAVTPTGVESSYLLTATVGTAWMLGVWAAFVALMVFLIAWVAEEKPASPGTAAEREAVSEPPAAHAA